MPTYPPHLLYAAVSGSLFADYGSDLGSGRSVAGDPAGARGKPGSGYGGGAGVRLDTPVGGGFGSQGVCVRGRC